MVSLAHWGWVCVFFVCVHILKPWHWVCRGFWERIELQRGCLYCSWSRMVAEYLTKPQFSYCDPEDRGGEAGRVKMQVTSLKQTNKQREGFWASEFPTLNMWALRMWWPSSMVCWRLSFPSWRESMKAIRAWPLLFTNINNNSLEITFIMNTIIQIHHKSASLERSLE